MNMNVRTNSKDHYSSNVYITPSLRHCTSEKKFPSLATSSHQQNIGDYQYSELDLLGKGYSSKVYKGFHISRPEETYAIKVIDTSKFRPSSLEMLNCEIEIQKSLNH